MGSPGQFINRSIDMYNNVIVPIINEYKYLMNETTINVINEITAFVKRTYPIIIRNYNSYNKQDSCYIPYFGLNDDGTALSCRFFKNDRFEGYIQAHITCDWGSTRENEDEYDLSYLIRDKDTEIIDKQCFLFSRYYDYEYDYYHIFFYWNPSKTKQYRIIITTDNRKVEAGWEKDY